ncbi:MAG: hypothetical protein M0R33_17270 [Methylomonas sp.]|jgi:hypothetical protein|uniref:hypothetical protein n=1 Tax=Methylomonas sp. TaxID=418 RepID=UPI0025CFEB36|nr:hypothetical protein [Methylomonas sp.]MCK9608198.1 hypothetical protein [Methylomonas sp.]
MLNITRERASCQYGTVKTVAFVREQQMDADAKVIFGNTRIGANIDSLFFETNGKTLAFGADGLNVSAMGDNILGVYSRLARAGAALSAIGDEKTAFSISISRSAQDVNITGNLAVNGQIISPMMHAAPRVIVTAHEFHYAPLVDQMRIDFVLSPKLGLAKVFIVGDIAGEYILLNSGQRIASALKSGSDWFSNAKANSVATPCASSAEGGEASPSSDYCSGEMLNLVDLGINTTYPGGIFNISIPPIEEHRIPRPRREILFSSPEVGQLSRYFYHQRTGRFAAIFSDSTIKIYDISELFVRQLSTASIQSQDLGEIAAFDGEYLRIRSKTNSADYIYRAGSSEITIV